MLNYLWYCVLWCLSGPHRKLGVSYKAFCLFFFHSLDGIKKQGTWGLWRHEHNSYASHGIDITVGRRTYFTVVDNL